MRRALLNKEVRSLLWFFPFNLVAGASTGLLTFMAVHTYFVRQEKVLAHLEVADTIGLWTEVLALILPLIFSLLVAVWLVSNEKSSPTLAGLGSLPVPLGRIWLVKFLVGMGAIGLFYLLNETVLSLVNEAFANGRFNLHDLIFGQPEVIGYYSSDYFLEQFEPARSLLARYLRR